MYQQTRIQKDFWRFFCFCLLSMVPWHTTGVLASASFAANVYQLPPIAQHESLTQYVYLWEDPGGKARLGDARQALHRGEFEPSFGNLNKGFTASALWFYVVMQNGHDLTRDLVLEVDYPMLDTLDVYCELGSRQNNFLLGDHVTKSARPVQVRNFLVPLTLEPGQTAACFFRVVSSSNVVLPLTVSDTHPYIEVVHDTQWLLGAFYGIAVGLLFFSSVIFFALRENMYLFYALHCAGGILFNSGLDGTASSLWASLGMEDTGVLVSVCLAQIGALYFALSFLRIRESHPLVNKVSHGVVALICLYALLLPFVETRLIMEIIVFSGMLFLFYMLFLGLLRIKDKYMPAWIFLAGWGPIILAAMLVVLTVLGLLQDSAISIYSMKLAWCLELVILSLGLGYSIRLMKLNQQGSEYQMLEARRENIDKTRFLAKVSHEVRGPMSGILGLADLLGRTPLNTEQKRYVKAIRNGSQALLEVTNDFLDYSKIEAGKMRLNIDAFNLRELVQDCAAIYEMAARKKGLKLVCIFEVGTPVVVEGDGGRVRQVLLNLISNALKYTEVGYIKIRIGLTDQIRDQQIVLKITVEDTGVGIDQKDIDLLFRDYTQLHQPVNTDSPSTGLGLSICRQLIELMGGEIALDSEPGRGSSFWFTLPVSIRDDYDYLDHEEIYNLVSPVDNTVDVPIEYSGNERLSPARDTEAGKEDASAPADDDHQMSVDLRILVVEDNEINLKVIHGFLDKLGLHPVTVNNGLEAVKHVTEGGAEYDLILMDCEMPIMDGYTAATRIHAWQERQQIPLTPIVALSAHATDVHRQKAREAGMALHIAKPLTFEKFTQAIDVVMGE
ncbi:MAG: 7TM diverse intracellular signaling domain-containing protein [Ketobacteraceae bacterium]|nr:7TM diverse intracellular signaling domain-containing protein [Ketobacteraceae bacterium]